MVRRALWWSCHVCGAERPDVCIAVWTTDRSAERGLPPGTLRQHVRYCLDRPGCRAQAPRVRLVPRPEAPDG